MENINLNISVKDLTDIIKNDLSDIIRKRLSANKDDIEKSLDDQFRRRIFTHDKNQFENALDWAIEHAFREGLNIAMEELNFKELIAKKAKEILSNDDFIKTLAEQKVRASLGLPQSYSK
jgi:3-methyladenine DNA glycosylase AlkC